MNCHLYKLYFLTEQLFHNGGYCNMNKKEVITLRCTKEEKLRIQNQAAEKQMNLSTYLLTKALETCTEKKLSTGEIKDWVDGITIANELYHLLLKTGEETLIAKAKVLLEEGIRNHEE